MALVAKEDTERAPIESELEDALLELGHTNNEGTVYVLKFDPEGDNRSGWGTCLRTDTATLDVMAVARDFGTGKYRFDFRDGKGRKVRSITKYLLRPDPPKPEPSTDPAAGLFTGNPGGLMEGLLRGMIEGRARQTEFLEKTLLVLVAGLAQQRQSSEPPMRAADLIEAFRAGKESAPAGGAKGGEFSLLMEAINAGIELGGSRGPENGGSDMFSNLAPKVLDVLTQALARPTVPAPQLAAGAVAGPVPPPAPAALTPGSGIVLPPSAESLVRQYAPKIMAEARSGRDPFTWGQYTAERVPDTWLPHLAELVTADQAARRQLLVDVAPGCQDCLDWLDDACEAMREVLAERSALPPEPSDTEPGNDDASGSVQADPSP